MVLDRGGDRCRLITKLLDVTCVHHVHCGDGYGISDSASGRAFPTPSRDISYRCIILLHAAVVGEICLLYYYYKH